MKNCKGGNYCHFIRLPNTLGLLGNPKTWGEKESERNLALFPEEREVTVEKIFGATVDELRKESKSR